MSVATAAPAMSPEQAADLAELTGAASVAAPVVPGAPPPVDPAAKITEELAGLVLMLAAMSAPLLPSLPRIYTPEVTQAAAAAVAAVCVKHGWLDDGLTGRWGEEVAAGAILLPLAFATYQGIRADLAAAKKTEPTKPAQIGEAAPAAGDAPGAKSVSFGAHAPAVGVASENC